MYNNSKYLCSDVFFWYRWPKCESVYHKVFVNAVMARGDHFKTPNTFIPALLTLQTVHLLSDKNVTEKSSTCLLEPRRTLEKYVATFIKRHKLAGAHAAQFFMDAVVCIVIYVIIIMHNCTPWWPNMLGHQL